VPPLVSVGRLSNGSLNPRGSRGATVTRPLDRALERMRAQRLPAPSPRKPRSAGRWVPLHSLKGTLTALRGRSGTALDGADPTHALLRLRIDAATGTP